MTTEGKLRGLLLANKNLIVEDLVQYLVQKVNTTKNSRREKALMYILENISEDEQFGCWGDELQTMAEVANELRSKLKSPKAITALDRIQRRVDWAISHIGCHYWVRIPAAPLD